MGVQPAGHAAAQPEGLMRRGSMTMEYVGIVIRIQPPLLFDVAARAPTPALPSRLTSRPRMLPGSGTVTDTVGYSTQ